jgi:putative ABC transport system ATP-binding protein
VAPASVALTEVGVARGRGRARRQVLRALTCTPAPGGLTVIRGPSGSGKTTLLMLIAGLTRADAGRVSVDGVDLATLDAEGLAALRRRRIGYLSQDPVAVGFLSATENLVLSLRWRGWPADAAARRAAQLLDAVGLRDRSRQRVSRLSAGEAQRVALARSLAAAPGLVIVDEPTSRLDRDHAGAVADLLAATASRERQTIVCASHDPEVIDRADHVVDLSGRGGAAQ